MYGGKKLYLNENVELLPDLGPADKNVGILTQSAKTDLHHFNREVSFCVPGAQQQLPACNSNSSAS